MSCVLQPNLLSAHRIFIQKLNVLEVGEELHGKGTAITLFIFTDSLEVGFLLCMHLNVNLSNFSIQMFVKGFSLYIYL